MTAREYVCGFPDQTPYQGTSIPCYLFKIPCSDFQRIPRKSTGATRDFHQSAGPLLAFVPMAGFGANTSEIKMMGPTSPSRPPRGRSAPNWVSSSGGRLEGPD